LKEADPEPISEESQSNWSNANWETGSDDEDDEIPDYPEGYCVPLPFDELPESGQTAIKKMIFETAITEEAYEEACSYVKLAKDDENHVFEVSQKKYVGNAIYSSEGAAAEMTDLEFIEGITAEDIIDIRETDFREKFGLKTELLPIPEEEEEEEDDGEVQSPGLMMLEATQEEDEEEAASSSSAKSKKRKKKKQGKPKSTKKRKSTRRRN